MSLPGLGLAEPDEPQSLETTEHELSKESEWRFEVAVGKHVTVKLLTGTAEIFGTELVIQQTYTFSGAKLALYTWHGCAFTVSGDAPASEYTAEETPMTEYANVHFALEGLRQQSDAAKSGPRVLILGPENAGKSTLAKLLTGYAVRSARQVVVVNLDPGEGVLSLPGTLTATAFRTLMDVEEGWGTSPMSGPSAVPVKLPLVYYYGLARAEENAGTRYKALVSRLGLAVQGRLKDDEQAKEAGVVIDAPGSLATGGKAGGLGYEIIAHVVSEFAVSNIVVLGSERLYSDMARRFDGKPTSSSGIAGAGAETIAVIKLPKSGGCVDRDEAFMKAHRAAQVKAYFFGTPDLSTGVSLSPRQQQVDFAHLNVFRLRNAQAGVGAENLSFLPGGVEDDEFEDVKRVPLNTGSGRGMERMSAPLGAMRNCLLAVMNADGEAEEDEVRDSSVMGFLYVVDVDEARGRINLLAPVAGRIPNRAIIWGSWPEEVIGMV